ncbi:hypothetical protein MMC12_001844 [Toensbergia leucococca]|nr:hypothetical protein [Toensbergia leucococca]
MLFIFADRASLVFVANLPWLYLLAAKNQPIKILTGYSYESLNIFHRRLGEIMCLLALLHSVGLIGVWYTILRPTGVTLLKFLLSKIILLGIGAFIAYETLYLTSLGSFRQRWYELFLGLHILLQVLGLVFVWFHHHSSRVYVGIALAIFLIDRLLYRMVLKNRSFRGSIQVKDDNETTVLSTLVPLRERGRVLSYLTGSGITYGWKATEHVFVTIPSLSRKHIIQAHPFTIASKAPSIGDTEVSLELIIRAQDGFSGDLVKYAKIHDSAVIRFDGPYGSQSAVQMLQDSDSCIVVAGGSGIAVAWPLVWSLLPTQHHTDLEHFGRNGLPKKILLVWIVQRRSHLTWIDKAKLNELQAKVDVIIPEPTVEHGRPDVENIIQSWISSHDGASSDGRDKIGIVCSGPDGMNRAVRNTCSSLLRQGRDVSVEVEKFGW